MFGGGFGGFGGNNNPFAGGFSELASDYAINRLVPGGLNSKILIKNVRFLYLFQSI
jgi:hypothetical protein